MNAEVLTASRTYAQVVGNLDQAVQSLLTTGFVELVVPAGEYGTEEKRRAFWRQVENEWPIGRVFVRKVIKRIARELKRPIVVVEHAPWMARKYEVTMRQRKHLAPLVAAFMLLPETEVVHRGGKATIRQGSGVRYRQDTVNWYVTFDSREAYVGWRDYVLNDPACRKALKLPTAEIVQLAA
jgi:hypothetical protein